jgi:hypothetical protein
MQLEVALKAAAIALAFTLCSCQPSNAPVRQAVPEQQSSRAVTPSAPTYKIVKVRDLPFMWQSRIIHRLDVRVVVSRHYQQGQVMSIAKAVVAKETQRHPVNAISILFYGPDSDSNGIYDVASVDWAPNGKWGDASSVESGDYRTFQYTMTYLSPSPPTPPSSLVLSSKKGLLRTPLPRGAVLVKKFRGDASAGRDPYEKYRINASATEIRGFYENEMAPEGWKKSGSSTNYSLIYRKQELMIGVLIDKKGGTFILMGS